MENMEELLLEIHGPKGLFLALKTINIIYILILISVEFINI